ncbi:MAG: hypothetical protein WCF85_02910 [Rhodospirillaceae bacterium]
MSRRLSASAAALLALMLALPMLSGCGKKPGTLDPPEGAPVESKKWPHIYPNPKLDNGPVTPSAKTMPAPEPMQPQQAYPRILHQGDVTAPSALTLPDSSAVGSWATPQRNN